MRIGFVGATGLMGHGMAKNIQAAGFELAFTLRKESSRVADLLEAGAQRAADAAELGRTCDVVVLCVTSSDDVEEVVAGEAGLLTEPREGLVIVDATTAEPASTRRLAVVAAQNGVGYVDAPLTKGPPAAESGTLNSIVAGSEADVAKVLPVIEAYSGFVVRAGAIGNAHTLKLVNNTIIQAFCSAVAEGMGVAAAAGLDPALVETIMEKGGMESQILHTMANALDGDFSGMEFYIDNARKDVRYYTRLAGELGHVAPLGNAALEALSVASKLGLGQNYVPELVTAQARLNGVPLGEAARHH